jgi:transcriptional regulator of acetoin/glycerol metabolism
MSRVWRHFARLYVQTVCGRGKNDVVRELHAAGTRYLVRLAQVDCEMILKEFYMHMRLALNAVFKRSAKIRRLVTKRI